MIENPISYLPHGEEIVAIKEIVKFEEKNISCKVKASGSQFNIIEYIAQAAAVGRIVNAVKKPKLGMIIRIKEFTVFSDQPCELIEANWSESLGGAYEVQGRAFSSQGDLIANALITMMEQI